MHQHEAGGEIPGVPSRAVPQRITAGQVSSIPFRTDQPAEIEPDTAVFVHIRDIHNRPSASEQALSIDAATSRAPPLLDKQFQLL